MIRYSIRLNWQNKTKLKQKHTNDLGISIAPFSFGHASCLEIKTHQILEHFLNKFENVIFISLKSLYWFESRLLDLSANIRVSACFHFFLFLLNRNRQVHALCHISHMNLFIQCRSQSKHLQQYLCYCWLRLTNSEQKVISVSIFQN